jgi:hypothetical protein
MQKSKRLLGRLQRSAPYRRAARLNPDWLIIAGLVAVALVPIVVNGFKPLWFDEVWRAEIISQWRMYRMFGEAPLPLLLMLLVKPITLVYNNEFTQRVVYMVFALGLMPLLYLFGRRIRSRKFGLMLAASLILSLYYLEYIIENKIFLVDSAFTVAFVWLFYRYMQGKLRLGWFLAFDVAYIMSSTSSVYLLAAAGLWQLYQIARRRETWRPLLQWALPIGAAYMLYYLLFLKPQITSELLQFWQVDAWKGQSFTWVVEYFAKHVLASFGFNVTNLWPAVGINAPVDGTGFISFEPIHPYLDRLLVPFGIFVMSWFVVGVRSLARRGWGFLPFSIAVTWLLSFGLAYFKIAPFGDNRANIFLFTLMAITAWLGLYEILAWLWRRKTVWAQGAFIAIVVWCAWFVPVGPLRYRLAEQRGVAYLDGMPTAASIVRRESTPSDYIVNFHFMNEPSFLYYYNYDSAIRKINKHPSENMLFDRRSLVDTPAFYKDLSQHHKVVWVVWGAGTGHDVTESAQAYYNVEHKSTYGYVSVARLTLK